MKKLSEEEFQDRLMASMRARHIFIDSGITKNISVAFALYQEIFAEREREIFLSTAVLGHRMLTVMDKYNRPQCPVCGKDMMFRILPENREGIKVQLVCQMTECDTVLNSKETLEWWQEQLRKQGDESKGLDSKPTESK